jgi:hypothetical protein
MSHTHCYCYEYDEDEHEHEHDVNTTLPGYEEIMASMATAAPLMPDAAPAASTYPVTLQEVPPLADSFETPPRPIRQTGPPNAPRKFQPQPPSRRVNKEEDPYIAFARNECYPGRIARYTLSIKPGCLAELETQTWCGIYKKSRFWLRRVNATYLEVDAQGWPRAIIEMNRGAGAPIKLLFETEEEADECVEYLFNVIGR